MENIVRVNIGGVAFTLNQEAYTKLDAFLKELTNHYKSKPYGDEIIRDIEERMAELLLERYSTDDVVTLQRVENLIEIMGSPSDFYESDEYQENAEKQNINNEQQTYSPIKKKLYRDTNNNFLGGVFSGLGHYFGIDAAWLRIGVILLLILGYSSFGGLHFSFHFSKLCNLLILAYFICWISIPGAKTYSEKCSMMGCDPGIRGAENFSQSYKTSSPLDKLFRWIFGSLLIFIGLLLLFALASALIITDSTIGLSSIPIFSSNLLASTPLTIIALILVLLLPTLFFIYEGVRIIGNLKAPKWHPGLWMILLWIVSLFILGIIASNLTVNKKEVVSSQRVSLNKYYDTLFVKYDPLPEEIEGHAIEWDNYDKWNIPVDKDLLFIGKDERNKTYFCLYPSLNKEYFNAVRVIETDSTTHFMKDTTVRASATIKQTKWYGNNKQNLETKVKISDSLIILYPEIYTKKSKFKGITQSVTLDIPDSCSVITVN